LTGYVVLASTGLTEGTMRKQAQKLVYSVHQNDVTTRSKSRPFGMRPARIRIASCVFCVPPCPQLVQLRRLQDFVDNPGSALGQDIEHWRENAECLHRYVGAGR